LKQLAIDLKDEYAAIAAGGDFDPEYFKIEFGEGDFDDGDGTAHLLDIAGDRLRRLGQAADIVTLAIPMRYSLAKIIEIDSAGVAKFGDEFVRWEGLQQLPEELGDFRRGFYKLSDSFDKKKFKYFFYAVPEDFIARLEDFAALPDGKKLNLQSEATALFYSLNLAADFSGFDAAISLETEGASVVLSHDGDFIAGRFIKDFGGSLRDDIMYYVTGLSPEILKPQILVCGDLSLISKLGDLDWADILKLDLRDGLDKPEQYATAAGLNLI
jgi:hypothetical protein